MTSFEKDSAIFADVASQLPPEYKLLEYLGEGGHGIVFKALYLPLQQIVALKIIKTDQSYQTSTRIKRMQNEAKTLAKLSHPNIVRALQMGLCRDNTPFMVCEFLEGITLAQYLKSNPQPGPKQTLQIFTQILDALECAHSNELLHRDVKPSNVIIITDSETNSLLVKLVDFGIARDFETNESQPLGLTRTIQISGSAPYMSPEQCRGERIDPRSDIYSVGCMLYECLSGSVPFCGETPMHTRYMQINQEPAAPVDDKLALTASRAAVYKIALQALSKNPDARPQSANEFKQSLLGALPYADMRVAWTKSNKRAKLIVIATCALICAIFFAITFYKSQTRSTNKMILETASDKPISALEGKKSRPHSKYNNLAGLMARARIGSFEARNFENVKRGITLINDFNAFLADLAPSEKALRFSALREKAEIELEMGFNAESEKSWKELLGYCKAKNGNTSTEAMDAFVTLGQIAKERNDWDQTEIFAKQALQVLLAAQNGQTEGLDIPALIDNRPGNVAEVYGLLGKVEEHKRNWSAAAEAFKKAESHEYSRDGIGDATLYLIRYLDQIAVTDVPTAMKIATERELSLEKELLGDDPNHGAIMAALAHLGDWAKKQNNTTLATKSYNAASKLARERRLQDLVRQQPDK